jgi:hypothetical protein
MKSESFRLNGGDHLVSWVAEEVESTGLGCYHGAFLGPTSGNGAEFLVNEMVNGGEHAEGQTRLVRARGTDLLRRRRVRELLGLRLPSLTG